MFNRHILMTITTMMIIINGRLCYVLIIMCFCCEAHTYLGDEAIQIGISGPFDVKKSTTYIIYGLIIKHDGDIGVLQKRVGG
jgi:hypothetical protein